MARAKRTDRAEARRRHRAAALSVSAPSDDASVTEDTGTAAPAPATADRPRSGIRYAFGAAFRPLDLRGDIAALPTLVRTRALIVPLVLLVVAAALWAVSERTLPPIGTDDQAASGSALVLVAFFGFQYFVMTPPIGGAFLGGFLAPRGSWLIGWIVGLAAAGAIVVLVAVAPSSIDRIVGTTSETRGAYIVNALLASPVFSALFAAAAAWYKRFLEIANPNRRRAAAASAGRPRRGGGNQRPFLSRASARRR
ncbi:MAG TPA: hypothetical protein VFK54_06055 [Candidatus Limnocylindrales bacterium]|nr:hypothetical protein [Candidatus Limnocylindrales bacterium]